jgi:hypothetical protein
MCVCKDEVKVGSWKLEAEWDGIRWVERQTGAMAQSGFWGRTACLRKLLREMVDGVICADLVNSRWLERKVLSSAGGEVEQKIRAGLK